MTTDLQDTASIVPLVYCFRAYMPPSLDLVPIYQSTPAITSLTTERHSEINNSLCCSASRSCPKVCIDG